MESERTSGLFVTHKLRKTRLADYFWKLDQWELYDLLKDPDELHNLYTDPTKQDLVHQLKSELYRIKKEVRDDDQYAYDQPPPGAD